MAIQRLISFEADADVHGRLRRIVYNGELKQLSILDIHPDEAATIIDRMSTGEIRSTNASGMRIAAAMPEGERKVLEAPRAEPAPEKAETSAADKSAAAPKSTNGEAKQNGAKAAAAPAKPPKAQPKPAADSKGEDYVSQGKEAAEDHAEAMDKAAKVEQAEAASVDSKSEQALRDAKKLRDIVQIFHDDMGIKDVDAMIAKARQLKDLNPVLSRAEQAGSLDERIRSATEILDLG